MINTSEVMEYVHLRDTGKSADLAAYYVRSARHHYQTNLSMALERSHVEPEQTRQLVRILLKREREMLEWLAAFVSLMRWVRGDR